MQSELWSYSVCVRVGGSKFGARRRLRLHTTARHPPLATSFARGAGRRRAIDCPFSRAVVVENCFLPLFLSLSHTSGAGCQIQSLVIARQIYIFCAPCAAEAAKISQSINDCGAIFARGHSLSLRFPAPFEVASFLSPAHGTKDISSSRNSSNFK